MKPRGRGLVRNGMAYRLRINLDRARGALKMPRSNFVGMKRLGARYLRGIKKSGVVGSIALLALIASLVSVIFSVWSRFAQESRWASEDQQRALSAVLEIQNELTGEGNRVANFSADIFLSSPADLTKIEVVSPPDMLIGLFDASDSNKLAVSGLSKVLSIQQPRVPTKSVGAPLLLRLPQTPNGDQGRTVEIAATIIEDAPSPRTIVRKVRAVVPHWAFKSHDSNFPPR
jgi:hypothetical protein